MPGGGWNTGLAKIEGSGRKKGTPNRKTEALKELTRDFFARIIDDEIEAKFWRHFITGYEAIEQPDGKMQIVPIPLDPVAFQAFKRAVEYKRGMPVQIVEARNASGESFKVEVTFCQPPQQ